MQDYFTKMKLELEKTYYLVGDYNFGAFQVDEIREDDLDGETYHIYILKSDDKGYLNGKMLFQDDIDKKSKKGFLVETEKEAHEKMIEVIEGHIKEQEAKIRSYRNTITFHKKKIDEI